MSELMRHSVKSKDMIISNGIDILDKSFSILESSSEFLQEYMTLWICNLIDEYKKGYLFYFSNNDSRLLKILYQN